jgi:predicted esterase
MVLCCALGVACARGVEPSERPEGAGARGESGGPMEDSSASSSAAAAEPDPREERRDPAPHADRPAFVELEVPGFLPAVVALPADWSRPRPALVAAHGAGDGARWQCEMWRHLLAARGFVLCPAGVPFGKDPEAGAFFRNHHELEREVLAALEALREAYGDALAPGPLVYTGYSQGATMGALMLVNHGDVFDRLVLVEGGYGEWNVSIAKRYGASGGQRVLFACGIRTCDTKARRSADALRRAGLDARVEYAEGAGHTYGGPVAEKVLMALDWVLEDDPRWR